MFWVSPTRRLYDLFLRSIHNMPEQTPAEVVALSAKHEVDFLPPPWKGRSERGGRAAPMKVLIAGAGVGGLTLALMLHRRGIETVIFEQASEIREVGVGINILPHAIKASSLHSTCCRSSTLWASAPRNCTTSAGFGQKVWSELRGTDAGFDFPAVLDPSRPAAESDPRRSDRQTLSRRDPRRPLKLQGFPSRDERGSSRISLDLAKFGPEQQRPCAATCSLSARDGIHAPSCVAISIPSKVARAGRGSCFWRGAAEFGQGIPGPAAPCISPAA